MYCFILYISLALLIRPGPGMNLPLDSESDEAREPVVLDMSSLKNAAEIMQLIKLMNKGNVKDKSLQRHNSASGIDIDYLGVSKEKGDIVNELMEMIKKNYSNKEKQVVRPHDRLIYISNPEVLEEYKKQQKTKERAVSLESDEGKRDDNIATKHLLDVLQHLRRFEELKDQNNEEKEPELDRPDKSIGTFTLVKSLVANKPLIYPKIKVHTGREDEVDSDDENTDPLIDRPYKNIGTLTLVKGKVDDKIQLRTYREDKYASNNDKFDPFPSKNGFESKHDAYDTKHETSDIKSNNFKKDSMKSSGERPKSRPKKEEDRFKDEDRYSDEFSSKKNRNPKKNSKINPMLAKIQMQDNPSFGNFGSLSKPKPRPIVKREQERERERERPRERERERERERPRESAGAFHSFGRTPVPYVGKRGIYEDAE